MSPLWFVVAWHFAMRILLPWVRPDTKKKERE